MNSARVILEPFENDKSATEESAEYKRGVADGLAQAARSDGANRTHSLEAIAGRLNDMAFGHEEARLVILDQLHGLIMQLTDAVLPQITEATFAAHLIDVVNESFAQACGAPIQITVGPDAMTSLEQIATDERFAFAEDRNLEYGQAVLRGADAQVFLDLPSLILDLQTALRGFERPERIQNHG